MLNFVLCDDNINILNRFTKMLNLIFVNNELDGQIVFTTQNPDEIITYMNNNPVDVLILDINFKSEISGIDIANKIRKINKKIYIIFATGHLEYLILAYKCKTFDYLPKPISMENLETTILRLFDDVNENKANNNYIRINNNNTILNSDLIYYIEKDKTKVIFKTKDAEYSTYASFNKIKEALPPSFIRCHKSYIVNTKNVESIENGIIHFDKTNTAFCSIGQVYKKNFLEVFKNELNSTINK